MRKTKSLFQLAQFWLFPIFGLLFFIFFYLAYGEEKFQAIAFYSWLWAASNLVLIGLLLYYPTLNKKGLAGIPDFDEPITLTNLIYAVFTALITYILLGFFNLQFIAYVPLSLTTAIYTPVMQFSWQLFIVAWSEEVLAYILYFTGLFFPPIKNDELKGWIGAVISRSVWAVFHLLRNPAISQNPLYILPAFIAGLIFFILLKITKSLPSVALAHGILNWISQFVISK